MVEKLQIDVQREECSTMMVNKIILSRFYKSGSIERRQGNGSDVKIMKILTAA